MQYDIKINLFKNVFLNYPYYFYLNTINTNSPKPDLQLPCPLSPFTRPVYLNFFK